MTSAVSLFASIDPTKNAKFSVSISEQLLREDGPRKRQRISVQCKLTDLFARLKLILFPVQ